MDSLSLWNTLAETVGRSLTAAMALLVGLLLWEGQLLRSEVRQQAARLNALESNHYSDRDALRDQQQLFQQIIHILAKQSVP